jgi:ABC-type multidrug transport system fused ATPase/permease subunit
MAYEDPQETREVPKSWREYLSQAKETINILVWAWRELKTPETIRRYKHLFSAAVLLAVFQVAQPRMVAAILEGIGKRKLDLVLIGFASYSACVLLQRLMDLWFANSREWLFGLNTGMLDHRITELFFEKSLGQHVEQGARLNPEGINTGRERLLNAQGMIFFDGISAVMGLLFSYAALWFLSPVAGGIMSSVVILYFVWMLYLNQRVIEKCTPLEAEWRRLKRYRVERWKNIERVKTSAKEEEELARMGLWFQKLILPDGQFWRWFSKQCSFRQMAEFGGLLATMIYGACLVWTGRWPLALLYPLFMWGMQLTESIWRIGHIERELNWNMPSIRLMVEGLSLKPEITSKPGAIAFSKQEPVGIVFEDVIHAYPLDLPPAKNGERQSSVQVPAPVLKNVSFAIKPGEKVALIGPSGAGKTTLMRLLLRFMDPESGAIKINGHNLKDVDLASWMRAVSYIPQQAQILDGTLRYNLTYGLTPAERESWPDERLWEFMRKLRIDFGERLTYGLDTVVGERGIKLSGGEAQRVMIGAAAIQHPPFMVIDEATSHLDSTTEREVHDGLADILSKDIGALVVAHRLSTVRDLCDRFIVLKNAEEVRNGDSQIEAIADSFEALYAISPTFKHLADNQGLAIMAQAQG